MQRTRSSNINAFQVIVSEGKVGRRLRRADDAERMARRVKDVDAARSAAIDIAAAIDLHAIGRARFLTFGLGPHGASRQLAPRRDVEDADMLALRVVDEETRFIKGKTKSIRLGEIVDKQGQVR